MESQFDSTTGFLGKTMGDFIQKVPKEDTMLCDAVAIVCLLSTYSIIKLSNMSVTLEFVPVNSLEYPFGGWGRDSSGRAPA